MSASRKALIAKIEALPPEKVAEVDDFVEFLLSKGRVLAMDSFLAVGEQIAKAGGRALTLEEVDAEIQAMRADARRRDAPRS